MESARMIPNKHPGEMPSLQYLTAMQQQPLEAVADALRKLPWADMARIAEHIADQYEHLRKADRLDRDGVAQVLVEMADDILKEAEIKRSATTTGIDQ